MASAKIIGTPEQIAYFKENFSLSIILEEEQEDLPQWLLDLHADLEAIAPEKEWEFASYNTCTGKVKLKEIGVEAPDVVIRRSDIIR